MPDPLSPSQLIFPGTSSFHSSLKQISHASLTVSNRLRSIQHDSIFISQVSEAYQLPLVANERCGNWYIPLSQKAGSAYFKSTDGHNGEWAFSLRRLNVQIFHLIGGNGGCIIVDSTRRGKSMPDALSKTVPIWIAVFNRLLFPHDEESHVLRTPAAVVSRSENVQIEQRLPGFVSELQKLHLDLDDLRLRLRGKPMEAAWITPDCDLPVEPPKTAVRNLTVLCTASGRTVSCANKPGSFEYVQGAADDSESWACGLTPILLWLHIDELLSTDEDDLPGLITRLASTSSAQPEIRKPVPIPPTKNLWIASNASAAVWSEEFDIVISCSQKPDIVLVKKDSYIHLPCSTGKNGSRQLRTALSKLTYLDGRLKSSNRVLVTCHTGRDLAVGVALALICLFCDAEGNLLSSRDTAVLSKAVIKHRLSWILLSDPTASPSRATLQSINAFLLG